MSGQEGIFSRLQWSQAQHCWLMDACRSGEWVRVPVTDLVGKTVDLGDKDGHVYMRAFVASFDAPTGTLVLAGGIHGPRFRPEEAAPLASPEAVWAYDVARGRVYSDEERVASQEEDRNPVV